MIEDILYNIKRPARYIGGEINQVLKDPFTVDLRVALAFPDTYEIGMSHAGLKILYHILNSMREVWAQRVFAPWPDMADLLEKKGIPLFSLEEKRPINTFDILGFSILYELSYTTIIKMLKLSQIPVYADHRSSRHPIVIAGGSSTSNPCPFLDFFDLIVIGDGEDVVREIASICLQTRDRNERIIACSEIDGVFAPGNSKRASRRILKDLEAYPFPEAIVVPNTSIVHDRIGIEVARGCTRGCRFCQAGMIYRPYRERSFESVVKTVGKALASTGYDDVSVLSLSATDLSYIDPLIASFANPCREISVGVPSVRVEGLKKGAIDMIASLRKTGFTLAPEAATDRLRQVINKGNTEQDLFSSIRTIKDLGWRSVKLYFMIGLPTEVEEDIDAICRLSKDISKEFGKGRISISISAFIPKPVTPFQWEAQISMERHTMLLDFLKMHIRERNISLKWQEPGMTFLEGIFSRGDNKLTPVILKAAEIGAYLDAWGDQFNLNTWMDAFDMSGVDPHSYLRSRDIEKSLPWDFIDMRIGKDFLLEERSNAYQAIPTPDCRYNTCSECGVCTHGVKNIIKGSTEAINIFEIVKDNGHYPHVIGLTKEGTLRFIGVKDWTNMLKRAIRRSGLPVNYSKGFSPTMKIKFIPPISFGIPSLSEYIQVDLKSPILTQEIISRLQPHLPQGASIFSCSRSTLGQVKSYVFKLDKPVSVEIDKNTFVKKGDNTFRVWDFLESFEGALMKIRFIDGRTISPLMILNTISVEIMPHEISKIDTVFVR